jgi:hypothetical protein
MATRLALTPQQLRELDVADCHDIVECMPVWNLLYPERQTEYFLTMCDLVAGRQINPFYELVLKDGISIWKEKKYMDTKFTDWVTPEMIIETYARMRATVEQQQAIQVRVTEAKVELEKAKTAMASNPDFKWGANDTVRDTQIAAGCPTAWNVINNLKMEDQKLADQKELVDIDAKLIGTMIDFFKVLNGTHE